MLGASPAPAPTVTKIAVAGGRRGGRRRLGYRRARDREASVVGGSGNADRGGGLGLASLVLVDTLEVKVIDVTVRARRERVVLVQLVRVGQEALESRHGHRARRGRRVVTGGAVWGGVNPFRAGLYMAYVYTTPEPVRHLRKTLGALVIGDGVPGNKDDNLADPQGIDGGPDPWRSVSPDYRCAQ